MRTVHNDKQTFGTRWPLEAGQVGSSRGYASGGRIVAARMARSSGGDRGTARRAVVALDVLPMLEDEAEQRKSEAQTRRHLDMEKIPHLETGVSRDQAAELFNTNPRYVSDAKSLQREAPELLDAVRAGGIRVYHQRNTDTQARELFVGTRAYKLCSVLWENRTNISENQSDISSKKPDLDLYQNAQTAMRSVSR